MGNVLIAIVVIMALLIPLLTKRASVAKYTSIKFESMASGLMYLTVILVVIYAFAYFTEMKAFGGNFTSSTFMVGPQTVGPQTFDIGVPRAVPPDSAKTGNELLNALKKLMGPQ